MAVSQPRQGPLSVNADTYFTPAYQPTTHIDSVGSRGVFCSITAMDSYLFSSFEELRFSDYRRGACPPQEADVTFFGMDLVPEQPDVFGISVLREQLLLDILRASLTCGDLRDTVFYLYSRKSSEFVQSPRPVFAISRMLVAVVPYFKTLLSGNFVEANITSNDNSSFGHSLDDKLSFEEYGYEYDSDLDETEEDWSGDDYQHNRDCGGIQECEIGLESIQSSLKASVDGFGTLVSTTPCRPGTFLRKVYVKDVAFRTWKALIFHIYTGRISFGPLRSQPSTGTSLRSGSADHTPLCSPKSMYRVADKYDLKGLKALARANIQSKITAQNVVPEVFSTFASRYPDIRNCLVKFYVTHRDHPDVITAMPAWIAKVVRGELPHAEEALNGIFRALTQKPRTGRGDLPLSAV
ncbi:hypothetical protein EDD17DRAFT_379521 [Pisolithus thermaeus]|nr:hypothetical protein EDD17DRAFT_379521 [Pisolithus thermaeus]